MKIIAKIMRNDYLISIRIFEKTDAASEEEIVEAVNKAAQAAEEDGFRGTYTNLPEKYLEIYGVSVSDYPIVDFEEYTIGETEEEKKGFHRASCEDCDSYDSGTCFKYGGTCNPYDTEMDCVHGSEICDVIIDEDTEQEVRASYVIPESMNKAEVAKALEVSEDRLYIEDYSGLERV